MKYMNTWFRIATFCLFGINLISPISVFSNPVFSDENALVLKVKRDKLKEFEKDKIPATILNVLKEKKYFLAKIFPHHLPLKDEMLKRNPKLVDLSQFYVLKFQANEKRQHFIDPLHKTGYFEYVEKKVIPTIQFTPNDPSLNQQYYFNLIQALDAYDIQQGDTNIVIGITDTGTELGHVDLMGNLKFNYNEPLDGIDNDNDGYIDNRFGWDLGMNDNIPNSDNCQTCYHGVHVSGISSAVTNNNLGIAGTGFKCKYLPVKIQNAQGVLNAAYEGIVYAADRCQIINCSWGSTTGGLYGQDIVNYAAINKGRLVVASAGNNGNNILFYPASYDNVLSVAATNQNDALWNQSSYGIKVDVCAPGVDIYSTWWNSAYTSSSGTSMAGPLVAGCAGIVWAQFPNFTAEQVAMQLKNSCDNINAVPQNAAFIGNIGAGRVNLYKALTQTNLPGITYTNMFVTDNQNDIFNNNDTLFLTGTFKNLLSNASNLSIALRTNTPGIFILDSVFNVGNLPSLQEAINSSLPFRVRVATPLINQEIVFQLVYTDGDYYATEYYTISVNVDYINIAINNIATTATSRSLIGYNSNSQSIGLGFRYNGSNSVLYESGLLIGDRSTRVMNRIRANAGQFATDFVSEQNIQRIEPPIVSEFDTKGIMNDNNAGANKIGIRVKHETFTWSSPGNEDFVLFKYKIINTSQEMIDSLYAGIWADWDIMHNNLNLNKTEFNFDHNLAYTYSTQADGLHVGIKLLQAPMPAIPYAVDLVQGGAGGVNLGDGFSVAEKYTVLSTQRLSAGGTGTGNDVASVLSSGPYVLAIGDSIEITYALLGANNLENLITASENAETMLNSIITKDKSKSNLNSANEMFPNPAKNSLTIYNKSNENINQIIIYNTNGKLMKTVLPQNKSHVILEVSDLAAGLYLVHIVQQDKVEVKKLMIGK